MTNSNNARFKGPRLRTDLVSLGTGPRPAELGWSKVDPGSLLTSLMTTFVSTTRHPLDMDVPIATTGDKSGQTPSTFKTVGDHVFGCNLDNYNKCRDKNNYVVRIFSLGFRQGEIYK